ncbi:FecR domain-containing protein [Rhizorhabdus dicambivorans]|uniref:Peptidoglycan-binding protein n=1 Tax=Rhizorhabdus dicambivorans TaxID=1850238 RepID=A0A2A4FX94_9SPHN|nr:FecR domain-containing protein [Rhizorhabdus dicambivorans]ATE65954.1 peptidoglycan-binding protein [Rhizorhabdus dicambivorans]PCE43069.1 peptidoglycan-binding protein [Rhizorhabdus dicambivorans]
MGKRHHILLALATVAAAFAAAPASAQQPPDTLFRYRVKPGDTLSAMARDYFVNGDYRTVQQLNRVADPRRLPIASTLLIPTRLLRVAPIDARVSSYRGTVTVDGRPVALAQQVREGSRVETGANANVTVTLDDGSAISLPSQSRIRIARLRRILLTGSVDRNFVMEAGRSRSSVTPFKDPESNFRVTTPLSVSAVRGTDFRVAVDEGGETVLTEVVGGTVGVAKDEEADETGVGRGYGVAATPAGVQKPVPLLPPPPLVSMARTPAGVAIAGKEVEGAARYRIQLATDLAFRDVIDEVISDKPDADFALQDGATFYVRLTAIAPSGMEGLPGTYAPGVRAGS